MKNNIVCVKLWDHTVGYLYWDEKKRVSVFEYDLDFLQSGLNIAPLTMSIFSERSKNGLPWIGNKDKLYQGLPEFIADSLPDQWGEVVFRAWLTKNKISTSKISPVDRLTYIGRRGMGALEYFPAHELSEKPDDIDLQSLYDFSKRVLSEKEDVVITMGDNLLWHQLVNVGTSAGGKRPKAIVAINPTTGQICSGQLDAPSEFIHSILKFDEGTDYPSAKIEYIYYLMAKQAGITMMPSSLITIADVNHFVTQRFDRLGNEKIHLQTLAAINPFCTSYNEVFATMRQLHLSSQNFEQLFRRMIFNVLGKNVDDHTKNFSFCLTRDGIWNLSPAYDLTLTYDYTAPKYVNRQSLYLNGKNDNLSMADFVQIGHENEISNPQSVILEVKDALQQFPVLAQQNELPLKWLERVQNIIDLG